ncbi:iron chelate uptake ABC transporter family permease subunit [Marinagarivorans algicola]|uniref:iron chelate uptake ABC transporter family permease subunit n=1 Tax=Marinagarivorans algicola TaxID=1513270 RepID=UPI0006B5ABD5|nr:iron chelate uptake ABC transporter family permease subunit [Marinagarivorans algicola]
MPDFLIYALISAFAIAIVAGPLGAFVVWQRLAYFGDTLAHGALLGVALGLFASINITLAITLCCLSLAAILLWLQRSPQLGDDSLLGLLSHSALAAGLVSVSLMGNSVDLFSYLFGDLLTTDASDTILIVTVCMMVLGILCVFWRKLLLSVIDANLAKVEGIPVALMRALLLFAIAIVVAFAMRVVGVLLITAMLIVPAVASRRLTQSPESMAIGASIIGCIAVAMGMWASYWYATPAGPSIVLAASGIFVITLFKKHC